MHTPAKGAGPNKGLGGSNPPFSAKNYKHCSFVISDKHLKLQRIEGLKRLRFKPFSLSVAFLQDAYKCRAQWRLVFRVTGSGSCSEVDYQNYH
jgi:hypothetical protein